MPAKITLTITEGKLKGKQFSFNFRTTCIIGRHQDCNIRVPSDRYHSAISRYHCLLDINPPDIRIRDFGSLHGTFVNSKCIGKRAKNQTPEEGAKLELSEYDLNHGDVITLGNTVFQVSIEQEIPPTLDIEAELNKIPPTITIEADRNLPSFPGYRTIKCLGQGGFGAVYLAHCDRTDKLVAIKTLLPQVAVKPYMKEMFLREARNTRILDHPHLIKLQDFDFFEGIFFFAMEYCDRGSVRDLINFRKGKLTVTEAIKITLQVLDGLHYAHSEKGLVHRDIKPGNIFLTVNNGQLVAKLGDYGLAKNFDLAGLSGQTATGTKMGTPVFMPRQQALNFKYAQPSVDVWAVAASLYYMLTLSYPRDFDSQEHPMLAILKTQPVSIRKQDSSIPQPLAELIDLALVDNPELHFKNAIAFKQALLSCVDSPLSKGG
ncbi:MAG: hypothetical protein Tsb0014_29950 [Pleurocapsa sp.]